MDKKYYVANEVFFWDSFQFPDGTLLNSLLGTKAVGVLLVFEEEPDPSIHKNGFYTIETK